MKQLKKAQGKFTGGKRVFAYDVVDCVKVPREVEQTVDRQMQSMRQVGAVYRDNASLDACHPRMQDDFMGVKRTLICAEAGRPQA